MNENFKKVLAGIGGFFLAVFVFYAYVNHIFAIESLNPIFRKGVEYGLLGVMIGVVISAYNYIFPKTNEEVNINE